ncbi:hypothetical protein SBA4_6940004 [Candidatus Sulfopaludibacter sp. SbA4]|nr:hypothetical protein SBA4_6940004 [Candidatus Sulfopaludibacter sp. SbA4]
MPRVELWVMRQELAAWNWPRNAQRPHFDFFLPANPYIRGAASRARVGRVSPGFRYNYSWRAYAVSVHAARRRLAS